VHVTVSTTNPDSSFVTQQARNLAMSLADEGTQIGFLIRDRDAKFSRSFDDVFVSEGIRVTRTPIRAPNAMPRSRPDFRSSTPRAAASCVRQSLHRGKTASGTGLGVPVGNCNRTPRVRQTARTAVERKDVLGGLITSIAGRRDAIGILEPFTLWLCSFVSAIERSTHAEPLPEGQLDSSTGHYWPLH
jgi:hypothetical protein